jgi:hypothetical protein
MPDIQLFKDIIQKSAKVAGFALRTHEENIRQEPMPEKLIQELHCPKARNTDFVHELQHCSRELSILRGEGDARQETVL